MEHLLQILSLSTIDLQCGDFLLVCKWHFWWCHIWRHHV